MRAALRQPVTPVTRVALGIATALGAGYSPIAPGTAGSAVALVILWLVPFSQAALVAFFVAVTVVGTWAAHVAEAAVGDKDPGVIVIDEVAGMTLSVLVLPLTVPVLLAGFVLFRIFDVVKPFPAGRLQALSGGVGVMIDDLIAGLYALLILIAARAAFAWP
ncbi:MAG: phosphatidylglycerophosphatase A [Candidatus Rokubacteria bacterium]|nr:phosphatidylglycerophosphatase A [Candidatus Rokubacteria bacterium]